MTRGGNAPRGSAEAVRDSVLANRHLYSGDVQLKGLIA